MTWEQKFDKLHLVYDNPDAMKKIETSTQKTLLVSTILAHKTGEALQEYYHEYSEKLSGIVLADALFVLLVSIVKDYTNMSEEDQRDVISFMHVMWLEIVNADRNGPVSGAPPFALYDAVMSLPDTSVG